MQSFGELKHQVKSFNEMIFGCGFYFYWNYEHKHSMRENMSKNPKGETLFLESMFDPCYEHSIEVYIKKCTEHNLPKNYYIPDHWQKPAFEIVEIVFVKQEELEDNNLVQQVILKLNFHTFDELDFYWIKASGFYFKKVK